MYNFRRLISKYSKYYDLYEEKVIGKKIDMENGGIIIEDKELVPFEGAIISTGKKKIWMDNGFSYTEDEVLYCYHKLNKDSVVILNQGEDFIIRYSIESIKDRSRFDKSLRDGLYIYSLKRGDR